LHVVVSANDVGLGCLSCKSDGCLIDFSIGLIEKTEKCIVHDLIFTTTDATSVDVGNQSIRNYFSHTISRWVKKYCKFRFVR